MNKLVVVILALALPGLAFATPTIWTANDGARIWSENFASMETGDLESGTQYDTGTSLITSAGGANKRIVSHDRFGEEANMMEHYVDANSTTWINLEMKDASQAHNLVRLTFDFFHNWRSTDNPVYHSHVRLRDDIDEDVARIRFRPDSRQIEPGNLQYQNSTPQAFDWWFNNTEEAIQYVNPYDEEDIRTLDVGNFDLYVEGALMVENDRSSSGTHPGTTNPVTQIHIYGHEQSRAQYFYDNFEMYAIPEPRTYSMILGFLAFLGVIAYRWRRSK